MIFPEIDPVAIQIGPVAIRWYGLAFIAGILLGWWYARHVAGDHRLWGNRPAPMTLRDIDDVMFWATLGIFVGGRLGYAAFYEPGHYLDDPIGFFRIWEGGMSFHGGLIGAIVPVALLALKRGIPALSLLDVVAAAVPIGLFLGRLANFINGELWGRVTDVPWGIIFCNPVVAAAEGGTCPAGMEPRHPSQIYEAALEGVVLFLILRLLTHHLGSLRRPGLTSGTFLLGYGLARMIVEVFREPDEQLGFISGFLTMGMILSVPMVLIGIAAIFWATARRQT